MKSSENQNVQSVERAMNILNCFSVNQPELSVSEMAKKLGLPKSTIVRILATLKSGSFIEQNVQTQKYRLGFRLYDLGNVYATGMDLRRLAYPLMYELNQKTSENVNLNIVDRGERVCIETIEGHHQIRNFVKVGERNSLCFGASGKVLLAFLPEVEVNYLISLEKLSVEERKALLEELRVIRRQGYSLTMGNRIEGSLGVSAPVFDSSGKVIAGISVSGPVERLKSKVDDLTRELLYVARLLSAKMGFNPGMKSNNHRDEYDQAEMGS